MAKNNMGLKTKSKILEAARSVFNEKGFELANVDEIAARAGITKAMVYYHFESKESIMLELVKMLLDHIRSQFHSEVGNNPDAGRMTMYIGKMMDVWKENQEIGQFIIARGIRNEAILSKLIEMAAPFFDMLIARGITEPLFTKNSPEHLEKLFLLLLFNTLPMIFMNTFQNYFTNEYAISGKMLQQSFRDMFMNVLTIVRQPGASFDTSILLTLDE